MKKQSIISRSKKRLGDYLQRRPHRSFRRTRRRDYKRSLEMPGYFAFTGHVWKTLWANRTTFATLIAVYALATIIIGGMVSQEAYSTLVSTVHSTSGDMFSSAMGKIGEASLLFAASVSGGFLSSMSEAQQFMAGMILLMAWLASVWLLRNILAGHKVKVRDGIYNSGAPIVSTFLITVIIMFQLLPVALAAIGYAAAYETGLLSSGVEAMLFWIFAGLMIMLSIYWVTGSFFALVVSTLPGMYPFRAIQIAGDLVTGRRLRILMRIIWMVIAAGAVWMLVSIPVIMFDSWLNSTAPSINWLPIVPLTLLALSAFTVIWSSAYIYLLYRKVVEDESQPA